MPSMKNRGTESRNLRMPSLHEAMHLPGKRLTLGTPHDPHDYLFRNIMKSNTKGQGKTPGHFSDGYDVKTRMNFPSHKGGKTRKTRGV